MREYLNYLYLKESINNLDKKYQKELENNEYLFLISNLKEFALYHNFFNGKGNYNLYKKYDAKIKDIIPYLLKDIKINNYEPLLIQLLFSYISTYNLSKLLLEEFGEPNKMYYKKLNDLDSYVAINYLNINPRTIELERNFKLKNELIQNKFSDIVTRFYYFNEANKMLDLDINNFIRLENRYQQDFFGLKRLYLNIKNLFRLKKDIPNTTLIKQKNTNNYEEFMVKFSKSINSNKELLTMLSENIYYNKNNLKDVYKKMAL